MSDIAYRVRTELARYVAGEISLPQLVDVLLPLSWTMPATEEHAIGDLLHEIELRLAEHSNGHLTEDELREYFSRLLQQYTIVLASQPQNPRSVKASSSTELLPTSWSARATAVASPWSVTVRAPTRLTRELTKTS